MSGGEIIYLLGANGTGVVNPGGLDVLHQLIRALDYSRIKALTVFNFADSFVLQASAKSTLIAGISSSQSPVQILKDYLLVGIGSVKPVGKIKAIHVGFHSDYNGMYAYNGYPLDVTMTSSGRVDMVKLDTLFFQKDSSGKFNLNTDVQSLRDTLDVDCYVKLWGCNAYPLDSDRALTELLQTGLTDKQKKDLDVSDSYLYSKVSKYKSDDVFNKMLCSNILEYAIKQRGGKTEPTYFKNYTSFASALAEILDVPVAAVLMGNGSESKQIDLTKNVKENFDQNAFPAFKEKRYPLFEMDQKAQKKLDKGKLPDEFKTELKKFNLDCGSSIDIAAEEKGGGEVSYWTIRDKSLRRRYRAEPSNKKVFVYLCFYTDIAYKPSIGGATVDLLQPANNDQLESLMKVFLDQKIVEDEGAYFQQYDSFLIEYPGTGYVVYDWSTLQSSVVVAGRSENVPAKKYLAKSDLLRKTDILDKSPFLNRNDYIG